MLKRIFAPPDLGPRESAGLLSIRLLAGAAFLFHGWPKIQKPFSWMGDAVPGWLQALAAVSEFGGGIAWILGALVPLASFGLLCTMGYATYFHMIQRGDPFVGKGPSWELAGLYFVISVLFLTAGPGRFSLDALLFRSVTPPKTPPSNI
jgi:putative oxidoreductase